MKHEIMWWMSRLTIMITSIFLSMTLAAQAYAAEIQMGSGGMLVFEPCELTVNCGRYSTFVNNELPPHNVMFAGHDELSHNDLAFSPGERIEVTFVEKQEIMISNAILMLVQV